MSAHSTEQNYSERTPFFASQPSYHSIAVQLEDELEEQARASEKKKSKVEKQIMEQPTLNDEKEFKPDSFYKLHEDKVTIIPIQQLETIVPLLKKLLKKSWLEFLDDFFAKNKKLLFGLTIIFLEFYIILPMFNRDGRITLERWKNSLPPGKNESCSVTYKAQAICSATSGDDSISFGHEGVPSADPFCFNLLEALCWMAACSQLLDTSKVPANDCEGPTIEADICYIILVNGVLPLLLFGINHFALEPMLNYTLGTYSHRTQNRYESRRERLFLEEPTILQETELQEYSNSNLEELLQKATEALNSTGFFSQRHELIKEHIPKDLASIVGEYLGVHLIIPPTPQTLLR